MKNWNLYEIGFTIFISRDHWVALDKPSIYYSKSGDSKCI
jgi:hypothetical protein